jgi:hypothetical protein
MSPRWLAILRRLFAAAVWLYPQGFRARFGGEMQAVFAEALSDAAEGGAGRVLALCARELRGLPPSLLAQYARAWRTETARLRARSVQPSWLQALAAIVPGLLVVAGYWTFRWIPGDHPVHAWTRWGGAVVFILLGVLAVRRGWRHTTWALPALGVLAWLGLVQAARAVTNPALLIQHGLFIGLALLALALAWRRGPRLPRTVWVLLGGMALAGLAGGVARAISPAYFAAIDPIAHRLYLVLAGLMPASLLVLLLVPGLWLARWHGLGAVLLLLGPCAVLIDVGMDPTYGLRSSPLPMQALMAPVLRTLLYGGLLVLAPLWVLRARTAAGQAGGVLLAVGIASLGVVVIPLWYWRQQMLDLSVLAQLILGLAAALAAYAAVEPRPEGTSSEAAAT